MKNRKNRKGFTLVELVIVIGVIGILAGILIPTFVGVTGKAQDAATKSDLANSYSIYAADAADGIFDDFVTGDTTAKGTAIEFKSQAEVGLAKEKTATKGYAYDATNHQWVVELVDLTGSPIVDHKYGEYYIFLKA